ncbi:MULTISPECIES: Imm63 family immunity protein [Luteibacter]|uniref:Imm63 family immunity protein n=1 Tax=Luteibacter TaxID=242605 RepID=UPI0006912BF6|nr:MULTISPECIES: Imm63 family immunity protein [unclassified Luteibacter]MDR6644564.1 hypothetical protein [Luteibacter sp. 1214]
MSSNSIVDLQEEVTRLGSQINAPPLLLIIPLAPVSDGTPYVELSSGSYNYVSSERGVENFRLSYTSSDELVYRIMDRVVSQMALAFELDHRVQGQDWRRVYFSRRVLLMAQLRPDWGDRQEREIAEILVSAPFSD